MKQGKDHIIFPLDVPEDKQARRLVALLHEHVGMFKVGLELFIRTGPGLLEWIGAHAAAGIFLDLKLHDIPATVRQAMRGVADLNVSLATVHCGESRAMLAAAVEGSQGKVGVLGVTVLTSVAAADLRSAGYATEIAADVQGLVLHKAAMAKAAGCRGVVCSGHEAAAIKARFGTDFLAVTPGIRPGWEAAEKDDQQRVVTPAMAIAQGADYLVIGRPIRTAADPVDAARRIAGEIEAAMERSKRPNATF
ncbi:MAG: orotidine-5'-phosphate decarboxylase [Desulfobacteraceae bacterium]|nr:MAG: orotidine-5'-phosphate decarboxylase [Desulfobacteraceae bacterium]